MLIGNSLRWIMAIGMISVIGCATGERRDDDEDGEPTPGEDPVGSYIDETAPVSLSTPDAVSDVLALSDPHNVMMAATLPLLFLIDEHAADPGCPVFIDESDMAAGTIAWRIQGGCTAMDDQGGTIRYDGQIVATGDADGTVIRYEEFRVTQTVECNGTSVETVDTLQGELQVPFAFSLAEDAEPGLPMDDGDLYPAGHYVLATLVEITSVDMACAQSVIGYAYDASVDIANQAGGSHEIVQMEGRVAWRDSAGTNGFPIGSWEMSAVDYTWAPAVCESEPLQGTLTVRAGGEEVTVRPDGATSCDVDDEPPCAPWSRNGQDQPGPICDYAGCSAGPDAPPPWLALAILLAGLLWQHRRRRDRSRTRG